MDAMKYLPVVVPAALVFGGAVLLAVGGVLWVKGPLGWAIVSALTGFLCCALAVRVRARCAPTQVLDTILELARRHAGSVAESVLQQELRPCWQEAVSVLAGMQQRGQCHRSSAVGAVYYVFPELKPHLGEHRCRVCDEELPLDHKLSRCPGCDSPIPSTR
jgi:hypothetical protein